jgi:hypothetical protein
LSEGQLAAREEKERNEEENQTPEMKKKKREMKKKTKHLKITLPLSSPFASLFSFSFFSSRTHTWP